MRLRSTSSEYGYKLPPTLDALEEHIKRVRLQSQVWYQATVMQQQPFDPIKFGYYKDTRDQMLPVTTKVLPAPQAIIELVRCQCKTNHSTQRCSCRRNNLPCTELCLCDIECANDEDSNIVNDMMMYNQYETPFRQSYASIIKYNHSLYINVVILIFINILYSLLLSLICCCFRILGPENI